MRKVRGDRRGRKRRDRRPPEHASESWSGSADELILTSGAASSAVLIGRSCMSLAISSVRCGPRACCDTGDVLPFRIRWIRPVRVIVMALPDDETGAKLEALAQRGTGHSADE